MSQIDDLIAQIEKYRDKFGVLVQPDGDGGDALNRWAHYTAAKYILNYGNPDNACVSLQQIISDLPHGRFRRHPDHTRWYSNPNNVTRDQMGPALACGALLPENDGYLKAHALLRLKRFMFHFDTEDKGMDLGPVIRKFPDPPSLEELAVIIRGVRLWALYPLLLVLDLALVASISSNLQEGQAILNVAVANKRYATPFGKLAKYLLKRKLTGEVEIRAYHSPERNGIVPLGELMILAKNAL